MNTLKLLVLLSLASGLFTSCQKEQEKQNTDHIELNETSERLPFWGDILAINYDKKRYQQSGCIPAVNHVCIIFDTYPYPWLWDLAGPPDFLYFYEVEPVDEGTDPIDVNLDEGTNTSLVRYSFYDGKVELEIIKYSDDSMHEDNYWTYHIPEDSYIKFGDSSTASELVANVLLKKGTYEIHPSDDENSIGTVSIDAEIELIE